MNTNKLPQIVSKHVIEKLVKLFICFLQDECKAVQTYLKEAETSWKTTPEMPLTSLEQARKQLEITDQYLSSLEGHREMISQLKSLAEDIDQQANKSSQALVDRMLADVMEKYNNLKLKAEERQAAMQVIY